MLKRKSFRSIWCPESSWQYVTDSPLREIEIRLSDFFFYIASPFFFNFSLLAAVLKDKTQLNLLGTVIIIVQHYCIVLCWHKATCFSNRKGIFNWFNMHLKATSHCELFVIITTFWHVNFLFNMSWIESSTCWAHSQHVESFLMLAIRALRNESICIERTGGCETTCVWIVALKAGGKNQK